MRRVVGRYIVPHIGTADFVRLRRSDIVHLLDKIEDNHGADQADRVLDTLRSIAGWVQSRDDSYVPPFVRGMRRVPAHLHQRSRILSDDELRTVWCAADNARILGDIIKLLLLTGQRCKKIFKLKWTDIDADFVWTVPQAANEKGAGGGRRLINNLTDRGIEPFERNGFLGLEIIAIMRSRNAHAKSKTRNIRPVGAM
jgi:integrase